MTARRSILALACIVGLFGAACGNEEPASTDGATEPAEASTGLEVSAANFAFSPTSVPVDPGAEIELTFTNDDTTQHSFTAEGLGIDLVVEGGASDGTTFTAPDSGNVEFVCKFHEAMRGVITTDGSGAGGAGSDDNDSQDLDY